MLYDIFAIHRVLVARSSLLLHRVACEQSDEHWSEDTLVRDALYGIDLDGLPKTRDMTEKLQRLFCAVYAGAVAYTPSEKPKALGFRAPEG